MSKFKLPAGTTNRHKWHKQAVSAIAELDRVQFQRKELYGIKGGDESESIVSVMFSGIENKTAAQLLNDIGVQFEWLITKENAAYIVEAVKKAYPVAVDAMPVDDNRKTTEERSEQMAQRNAAAIEREAEQGRKNEETAVIVEELRKQHPSAIADNGKMSDHARAAKNIKLELKAAFPGVAFSVTSDSFSMGNAVRVGWDNGPCVSDVDAITDKYQYYIDKCTNDTSPKASAVNVVLGQAKYVSTSRSLSSELKEQVGRDICKAYGEEYDKDARIGGQWLSDAVWQALHVTITGNYSGVELVNNGYVAQFEAAAPQPTNTTTAQGVTVQEGTKPGYLELIFSDKPNEAARDTLKAAGFRWSRYNKCWYGKAENLPAEYLGREDSEAKQGQPFDIPCHLEAVPSNPELRPDALNAKKFRAMAEKLTAQIEDKLRDRETNTAKRLAQAAHSRLEGERLKRTQQVLYALADLHEKGAVPAALAGLTSKKAVYDLMHSKTESVLNGYHSYSVETGEPSDTSPASLASWALLTGKTEEEKEAEELKRLIDGLQFSKIPGYFPTPVKVVDMMLSYAQLEKTDTVLEPSLGSCAIADRAAPHCAKVEGFEVNHTLAEIAERKGYLNKHVDFLKTEGPGPLNDYLHYDKVLMNPPFEQQQDIKHVMHAFRMLKPGGRLVSIMSPGFTFRDDKLTRAFKTFIDNADYSEVLALPDNSFKESGTGVNTVMLILDKKEG